MNELDTFSGPYQAILHSEKTLGDWAHVLARVPEDRAVADHLRAALKDLRKARLAAERQVSPEQESVLKAAQGPHHRLTWDEPDGRHMHRDYAQGWHKQAAKMGEYLTKSGKQSVQLEEISPEEEP